MRKSKSRATSARRKKGRTARPRARRAAAAQVAETALSALAHEIRTPLTGILAFAELLCASELQKRERDWAAGIKSAADHLAQLTTLVVDAARGRKTRPLLEKTFSPRDLVQAVGAALHARAQAGGIGARVTIAEDLPEQVIGDPVRLRAALENLIDNAIKFTPHGEVRFELAARKAAKDRVRLRFIVTDSGIGLGEKEIKRLFKPFTQAHAGIARQYGGSGLGLSLVKRVARMMQGDLTVTSKPGKGSRFTLDVVLRKVNGAVTQASSSSPAMTTLPHRVLCVEDSPYGRVLLNTILGELGHRPEFAGSGEAALEMLARGDYDVVLMDVVLAGLDGIEITRRIRARSAPPGKIPIIGISARTDPASEAAARAAGMDAYLHKPLSPAMLAQAIAAALALER